MEGRGGLIFEARRVCVSLNLRLESNKEKEEVQKPDGEEYRGTSLTRKRTPIGPYRRPMSSVLGGF